MEPSKKVPLNATAHQERSRNSELTAAYEQLRCQVLGVPAHPPRGPGLAVFLERGMEAWIETYQRWAERAPVRRQAPVAVPSRVPVPNELVALLTGLLLERTTQEER